MTWKPEAIALLTDCWNVRGLTASQTVREFAARGITVTKNAVIGKASRLGLKARPSPLKRRNPPVPPKRAKPKPPRLVSIGDRICRWPIGHPGEAGFRFCDEPAVEGKPYCPAHAARAYVRHKSAGVA